MHAYITHAYKNITHTGTIDPVVVTSCVAFTAVVFRAQLGRLLRRLVFPHHRAHHVVVFKLQVAIGGNDAPHLSTSCRTVARMVHEGILSQRLTADGYDAPDVKPGAEALTPAVRYGALLLRNATACPGLVHARVEVDAFYTRSAQEVADALDTWESMTLNEEMRGVPKREYPHRPGVYQYGTANECPKPGVAGIALAPQPRWLDSWQTERASWDETLWRLPRNRAPVEVVVVYPPMRTALEQEMLEDRRAANQDKAHRARFGSSGGYLKALRQARMSRQIPLATEEEWVSGGVNASALAEYERAVNESAAQGLLPPPPPVTTMANRSRAALMSVDEWVDVRTVDFAEAYTAEYGDEWTRRWPLDLAEWKGVDAENARQVQALRDFYRRERDGMVRSLADDFRVRSLVASNFSSGLRLDDDGAREGGWEWGTAFRPPAGPLAGTDGDVRDATGMGGKGGIAEAWAAEEEEMELMRDELEAAEQVVSVCAFARPRAAREGFRVCCCVRA